MAATRLSASASAVLKAAAPSASGNPSARHNRFAGSTERPAASATSPPVSSGTAPTIARSRASGAVIGPGGCPVGSVEELIAHGQLCPLDLGDVTQLDPTQLARIGDDQGAAAEHAVDEALLVGDVADPVQRDVVPAAGEHTRARDQAPAGEGVRRQ